MSEGWRVTTGETLGRLSESQGCVSGGCSVTTGETLGRLGDSHRVLCLKDGV